MPFSYGLRLSLREWLAEEIARDADREELEHRGIETPERLEELENDQLDADREARELLLRVLRENGIGPVSDDPEERGEVERNPRPRSEMFGLEPDGYPPGFRG